MNKAKKLATLMQRLADLVSTTRHDPTRLTCFVCYDDEDYSEVESFIRQFAEEFVPRCVGVTPQDSFVGSLDDRYIADAVREEILGDSTVTILLLGRDTWKRSFVDWEIAASLLETPHRQRNGILAMPLPSMGNKAILPERVRDNFFGADNEKSAVIFEGYPTSRELFRAQLDHAHASRSEDVRVVDNARSLRRADLH